jgi:hypothetical protein
MAARDDDPAGPVHDVEDLATAVSDRGDALVAWTESQELGDHLGARIRLVRRPAGQALGEPGVLAYGPPGARVTRERTVAAVVRVR